MTAIAIATFADEGPFLRARLRAITEDRRILGEWTPFASEALAGEDATGGILLWTLVGGLLGAATLFALESWSAVSAYPFDTGGRTLWTWQAFIPAPVEFAALTAAIAGVIRFFLNAGLTRLHDPAFDFEEVLRANTGFFVLALTCDTGADANGALALLAQAGAEHSRLVTP